MEYTPNNKILLVDDKPENLYVLEQLLKRNSYETESSLSGEDALKKVLKYNFALILLDVQMPDMSGIEVAELLKGNSKTRNIPIIFLTAIFKDRGYIIEGLLTGAVDYMPKPIDDELLLLKVKTFTKLFNQQEELKHNKELLEVRVEDRTKQIKISNDLLKDEITDRKQAQKTLQQKTALLNIINQAQSEFLITEDSSHSFDTLLKSILSYTKSEYGFMGEILHDPKGDPYIKMNAITNIAWNKETKKLYEKNLATGMEFRNLNTLFGVALTTGKSVISNTPSKDPRRGGIPKGHPPLDSFIGMPFYSKGKMTGIIGLANRKQGYNEEFERNLQPLLSTVANIVEAYNNNKLRKQVEAREFNRTRILQKIIDNKPLSNILKFIIKSVEQQDTTSICSILLLDPDGKRLLHSVSSPNIPNSLIEALHNQEIGKGARTCGASAYSKQRVIIENILTHPNWEPYRELVQKANLKSCWCEPIISSKGNVLGTFAVYHREFKSPTEDDIIKLKDAVYFASLAIERKLNEVEIRKHRNHLKELVTERTKELEKTKKRLEFLLTSAPVVIYSSSIKPPYEATYVGVNIKQMMGYEPQQFIENPDFWNDKIHPDDVDKVFTNLPLQHLFKTGSHNHEYKVLHNDGTYRWMQDELEIVKDKNGKPIEILGYWTDITERKNYEEQLKESLKEISDYKYALDESSIVSITDTKGVMTYVNNNFCKITKYTRDELIGTKHTILNSEFHPKEYFINLWRTVGRGKIWRGEFKNIAKDGSFYWIDSTIVPFLDKKRKPYQYVTITQDITHKKIAEEDLINAKEAADAANIAKSEFLANMSHEIRTPMNAIIGFSEMLSVTIKDEKRRSQVASIYNSGKNLLKIINDILDLSKIEAGKLTLQKEAINIHNLVKDLEMIFIHKTEEKSISFLIEIDNSIPTALLLDETRLRQILFNLLGNAIKFTDKGQVTLGLKIKNIEENKIDLIIKIEDSGIGIPKKQQEKIFEAFSQQEGQINSKYGGTGLGLSITKRLVEIMEGKISVKSKPGKGSVFEVYLPNVEIGNIDDISLNKIQFDPSSIIFKESTVLIVDDNKENRNLISDLLLYSPITIFEAENGEKAVEIATKNLPDLILMDLKMPVMNGYEASKLLKNQETTKSIPIISISASVELNSEDEIYKNIFDDSLMKPVDLTELVEVIKKYLKYKTIKKKAVTTKKETKEIKFELTTEELQKLPELIHILEKDFMPAYTKALETQMIDQIEQFGKDLVVLAETNNSKIILNYGNEICKLANNFEIDKLISTLNMFPQIIKQHKSFINNL